MFISMYTHMGLNFSYIWAIYVYIKIAILSARNASGKKKKGPLSSGDFLSIGETDNKK